MDDIQTSVLINNLKEVPEEGAHLKGLIIVHEVSCSVDNDSRAVWEHLLIDTLQVLGIREDSFLLQLCSRHRSIDEESRSRVGLEIKVIVEPCNVLDILNYGIEIDAPLHSLVVRLRIVDDVACNEVSNAYVVLELSLDHLNRSLPGLPFDLEGPDLLQVVHCSLDSLDVLAEADRSCIHADEAAHSVRVHACESHGDLSSHVVADEGDLVDLSLVGDSKNIFCHFPVGHA